MSKALGWRELMAVTGHGPQTQSSTGSCWQVMSRLDRSWPCTLSACRTTPAQGPGQHTGAGCWECGFEGKRLAQTGEPRATLAATLP